MPIQVTFGVVNVNIQPYMMGINYLYRWGQSIGRLLCLGKVEKMSALNKTSYVLGVANIAPCLCVCFLICIALILVVSKWL